MTNPLEPNFDPGGIIDRVDLRDFHWDEIGGATMPSFDWNKGHDIEQVLSGVLNIPNFKLTVKDQNGSFSCGGQAWSYMAEVLEALSTKSYEPRSAKYLYSQTYVPGGGSRGRDNAEIFVNQGVCRENVLTSYDHGLPPDESFMEKSVDITDIARKNARLSMASAYAQTGTNIDDIASATSTGSGTVIGIYGQNNGTWNGLFPKPPSVTSNSSIWGHWVYAGKAKLINGVKHIGILNSWGKDVGDKGWQWLSEEYFKQYVFSGWTHIFAPPVTQSFTYNFMKNINFGENDDEVKNLQTALRLDGTFPFTVSSSGLYGDITRRAVLDFQQKYKIISTPADSNNGKIVGPKTRVQLNKLFNVSN